LHLSAILDIYLVIVGSSEYLCSGGGVFCNHSIEFEVCVEKRICRLDLILSQRMKINIITLTNEIIDPIDDTTFHAVYPSG
jgi:hypothetical protein